MKVDSPDNPLSVNSSYVVPLYYHRAKQICHSALQLFLSVWHFIPSSQQLHHQHISSSWQLLFASWSSWLIDCWQVYLKSSCQFKTHHVSTHVLKWCDSFFCFTEHRGFPFFYIHSSINFNILFGFCFSLRVYDCKVVYAWYVHDPQSSWKHGANVKMGWVWMNNKRYGYVYCCDIKSNQLFSFLSRTKCVQYSNDIFLQV